MDAAGSKVAESRLAGSDVKIMACVLDLDLASDPVLLGVSELNGSEPSERVVGSQSMRRASDGGELGTDRVAHDEARSEDVAGDDSLR